MSVTHSGSGDSTVVISSDGAEAQQSCICHICVVVPVFNDWQAAALVIAQLDRVLHSRRMVADVIIIDDGSTSPPHPEFLFGVPAAIARITLLELRKNLGHQRALAVGLVQAHVVGPDKPVLVMDADGEDAPEDVPSLVDEYLRRGGEQVIFAARVKRSEGVLFRLLYRVFQVVHWALVGFGTNVGNFSVVPPRLMDRLTVVPEIWNHYAAAVVKSKIPYATIPVARSKRIVGQSKMGLIGLVLHGLSAISVYGETVGARLFLAFTLLSAVVFVVGTVTAVSAALTHARVPDAVIFVACLTAALLLQGSMFWLLLTIIVLHGRAHPSFLPIRDAQFYIARTTMLFDRNA